MAQSLRGDTPDPSGLVPERFVLRCTKVMQPKSAIDLSSPTVNQAVLPQTLQ
jgi:hypothetical protein